MQHHNAPPLLGRISELVFLDNGQGANAKRTAYCSYGKTKSHTVFVYKLAVDAGSCRAEAAPPRATSAGQRSRFPASRL